MWYAKRVDNLISLKYVILFFISLITVVSVMAVPDDPVNLLTNSTVFDGGNFTNQSISLNFLYIDSEGVSGDALITLYNNSVPMFLLNISPIVNNTYQSVTIDEANFTGVNIGNNITWSVNFTNGTDFNVGGDVFVGSDYIFENSIPNFEDIFNFNLSEDFGVLNLSSLQNNITDLETSSVNLVYDFNNSDSSKISVSLDNSTGIITLTSLSNQTGDVPINITVRDENGGLDSNQFILTLNSVNDNPWNDGLVNISINEDNGTSVIYTNQELNNTFRDVEEDQNPSTYVLLESDNSSVGCSLNVDNDVSCVTVANQSGSNTLTLEMNDSSGLSTSFDFLVNASAVNDVPFGYFLNSPLNESNFSINTIQLSINNGLDVENDSLNYYFEVWNDTSLTQIGYVNASVLETNNTTNDTTVVLDDGDYYWRVLGNDGTGNGSFTDVRKFTVDTLPPSISGLQQNPSTVFNNDSVTLNATISDLFLESIWLESDFNGSFVNYTDGINNDGSVYFYTIDSGNLSNQQVVSYRWYGNDSVGQVGNGSLQSFTVQNRAPNLTINLPITMDEDSFLEVNLNATDPDGDSLSYTIDNVNPTGKINVAIIGNVLNLTSVEENFFGGITFDLFVRDPYLEFSFQQITVNVTSVNDIAVINVSDQTITEDLGAQFLNLSLFTTDIEDDPGSFNYSVVVEDDSKINATISGSNLTYQSAIDWFGVNYFNLTANDGTNISNVLQLNITVTNVNDAPNITSTAIVNTTEDSIYTYQLNASDKDNDIVSGTDTLTYSLLTNPSGMNIDSSTGLIVWLPTNTDVGNNSVSVNVSDGKGGEGLQTFTLSVSNVNDLPSVPSLTSPTSGDTIFVNSVSLNWTASTDDDGDNVNYFVFFSNETSPSFNTSTTNNGLTINNLEHLKTYYWYVVAGDGIGNQTKTETRNFLVSLKNNPVISTFSPASNPTISENATQNFSVVVTDSDVNDAFTYSWTLDGGSIGSNISSFNFNPNFTQSGTHTLVVNVNDSFDLTDSNTWTVTVTDNQKPQITSSSPLDNPAIKSTDSQLFSINVQDTDVLTYSWTLDGVSVGTNSNSYNHVASSNGTFNIKVNVSDGDLSNSKSWTLTVSDIPIVNTFPGTGTTDFSKISDLSKATNIVLEKTEGKIDFRSEVLDLRNVIDTENNIKIEKGIVAINTSRYSQLNKPARIVLKGLSYNSIPTIFSNSGFTTNGAEITQKCDFCTLQNFTDFPTTNGEVIFDVSHFSSFKIAGSGEKFDISTLEDLDSCEAGELGDLKIEIKDPDSGDDFKHGDTIDIEVDVDNNGNDDLDVTVEAILYNLDEDEEVEDAKGDDTDINEGDEETFEVEMEITDDDFDDSDDYILFVKAFEEGDEDQHCSQSAVSVNLEREKHDVIITDVNILPNSISCGEVAGISVKVENVGSKDEDDVYIEIRNSELGFREESERFDLDDFKGRDEKATKRFNAIRIPVDADVKDYQIEAIVHFDDDDETDSATETLKVTSCGDITRDGVVVRGSETLSLFGNGQVRDDDIASLHLVVDNKDNRDVKASLNVIFVGNWADGGSSQTINLHPGINNIYLNADVIEDREGKYNAMVEINPIQRDIGSKNANVVFEIKKKEKESIWDSIWKGIFGI